MTERQLTVITGGKDAHAEAIDAATARAGLARTGAEFVARLDLQSAQARFSALLDGGQGTPADEAVDLYRGFARDFPDPSSQPSLDRHRAIEDATIGGTVRWFDIARGYGFVIPDNGLPDVYLHANTLRLGGFRACPEGARIVCLITQEEDRYRVTTVQAIDCSTSIDPSQLPRRGEPSVTKVTGWAHGTVQSFEWRRGHGVVCLVGGSTVRLSLSTLRRCGMVYVEAGDVFDVLVGESAQGAIAVEVRLPGTVSMS